MLLEIFKFTNFNNRNPKFRKTKRSFEGLFPGYLGSRCQKKIERQQLNSSKVISSVCSKFRGDFTDSMTQILRHFAVFFAD